MNYYQNFINGKFVDGSGGRINVTNPGNNKIVGEHAVADKQDVNEAVQAAKNLHQEGTLYNLRPVERGRMVQSMGTYILKNKSELAELLTREQGKPLWESHLEIEGAARYFEYYGNQAETLEGKTIPLGKDYLSLTVNEPYGVSAQIIPWNYPLEMSARSLSAALATGNSCVIKSPELTPITHYIFAKAAIDAGLPNGAVNIVCGFGKEAGATLASHPEINQIVFTGSVTTGRSIATAAAKNIVPSVLELGGKSAAIVFDDADLDLFENDIRWGIFFNAGQVCSAMSRVIVHEKRYDEVLERAHKVASSLSVNEGINLPSFGNNMGAMVSEKQRDRVENMVSKSIDEGAKIICGGHKLNREGAFFEPTVLNCSPDNSITKEEVFGPVLSVMRFNNDEEAISISNSTDFGLVGGVFTKDLDRATYAVGKIQAGQVFINEWYAGGVETPFGGYGKSGYGREKGREALWNYVQTKNITIRK